jgi:hypothetical protein
MVNAIQLLPPVAVGISIAATIRQTEMPGAQRVRLISDIPGKRLFSAAHRVLPNPGGSR